MSKYMPWVDDQEPQKKGVFQRDITGIREGSVQHFGYYDKKARTWYATGRSPEDAMTNYNIGVTSVYGATSTYAKWRGLTEEA